MNIERGYIIIVIICMYIDVWVYCVYKMCVYLWNVRMWLTLSIIHIKIKKHKSKLTKG